MFQAPNSDRAAREMQAREVRELTGTAERKRDEESEDTDSGA